MSQRKRAYPPVARMCGRALRLKCPRCGSSSILASWFRLKKRCPTCALAFERGEVEDYWLGAYAINLVVGETAALIGTLVYMYSTWPEMPYAVWVGVSLAVSFQFSFFPFSRTLWLAWDLSFRRNEPGD